MLKITTHTTPGSTRIELEGRLAGPWVEELERYWNEVRANFDGSLVLDLTGVSFIEQKGKSLLTRMWRDGAELLASGCCTKSIVDDITKAG